MAETERATMPLYAWIDAERARLRAFEHFWIEGMRGEHLGGPEAFPRKMPEGEWDEQYRSRGDA